MRFLRRPYKSERFVLSALQEEEVFTIVPAELQQRIQALSDEYAFSGVITIQQGDTVRYEGAFGWANRGDRVPNTLETLFAHASVTKMFTAVSVLQLVAQGDLSLDTLIVPYLGLEGRGIGPDVTLHHLLTHTSGIADYFEGDDPAELERVLATIPRANLASVAGFLPLFADKDARFAPGARFEYNNAGYILLGLVVEKATGRSYFDYVRQHIFAPAGMGDADFLPFDLVREGVAEGYIPVTAADGAIAGWRRNIYAVPPYGSPDGGAYASAKDMTRFMRALRAGRLMEPELLAKMLTPHATVSPQFAYGYGLWLLKPGEQIIRYGHTGEDAGVSARVMYYPEHDLDLVILCNQGGCAGKVLAEVHQWIQSMATE